MTSMLKRVDVAVFDFVKDFGDGKFSAGATSSTSRPTASATPPPVARSTTSRPSSTTTRQQIIAGKITVPTKPADADLTD